MRATSFALITILLCATAHAASRPAFPESFTWKGQTWYIAYNNLGCGHHSIGCTVFTAHVILIHRDLPLVETKDEYSEPEIVLHEIEHVVTGKDFPNRKLSGHQAIRRLQPLAELLGENPQLGRYFADAWKAARAKP